MKYILYAFYDNLDRPYYVGRTSNFQRRLKQHKEALKKGNNLPKYARTRELKKIGHRFTMRSICRYETLEEVIKAEMDTIKEYRKKYDLTNLTEGGLDTKRVKIGGRFEIKKKGPPKASYRKNKRKTKKTTKKMLHYNNRRESSRKNCGIKHKHKVYMQRPVLRKSTETL